MPDLMNPLSADQPRDRARAAAPRGHTVLVANTDSHDDVEVSAFEPLLQRRVDGFILATGRLGERQIIEEASAGNVPVVLVNRDSGVGRYPFVPWDDAGGIVSAITHLVERGHRHIVHVAGPPNFSTTLPRSRAFRAAALNAGILRDTINAESVSVDAGCAAAEVLLECRGDRPTALVAGNDLVALGQISPTAQPRFALSRGRLDSRLQRHGVRRDFWPPLTTVHLPLREIGGAAARLLLGGIESGEQEAAMVTLPLSLVVRGSNGRPRS